MNWIYELTTVAHVFGAVLGAGAAFVSDTLFFASIQDRKIEKIELRFLKIVSSLVWLGLAILIISGIGLVILKPELLSSHKFWAKMTIVAIITINGLIFHRTHMPILEKIEDKHVSGLSKFQHSRTFLLASGVVSVVSWISTLVLGSFSQVPFTYLQIMAMYFAAIATGLIIVSLIKHLILPTKR